MVVGQVVAHGCKGRKVGVGGGGESGWGWVMAMWGRAGVCVVQPITCGNWQTVRVRKEGHTVCSKMGV